MHDSTQLTDRDPSALKTLMQTQLAAAFELSEADLFGPDLTIAEIIATSAKCINSLDFMEACAKVINHIRKTLGATMRLPATSHDTRISAIIDSFVTQVRDAAAAAQASGRAS
jgi:hypothetical protein